MKIFRKVMSVMLAALFFAITTVGTASAAELTVTWAFLFPVPLPLPVWSVTHPDTAVTWGFLFPFWLPLPVYNYDERGPRFIRAGADVPPDAVVYIDGVDKGPVSGFSDDARFRTLPDGTHTVELKHDGKTLYAYTFGVKAGKFVTGE